MHTNPSVPLFSLPAPVLVHYTMLSLPESRNSEIEKTSKVAGPDSVTRRGGEKGEISAEFATEAWTIFF